MSDEVEKPEVDLNEIWADDLLGRRSEADILCGFIKSIGGIAESSNFAGAYTIAVDGQYGEGKSFFLRRLARQLSAEHAVAFVDAWADDLADEPLTALAATIKEAIQPALKDKDVRDKWQKFLQRGGAVAKIVATGLAKRALAFAITEGATDQLEGLLNDGKPLATDAKKALGESSKDAVDASFKGADVKKGEQILTDQISAFERSRRAIQEMRDSLEELVDALSESGTPLPIIIIIDELDRCRPSYAVKLLEEIKHLFGVRGLFFVFGTNGGQLAHSVSGAYGPGFDGKAYLRRFFNRTYQLAKPALEPLVAVTLKRLGLDSLRAEIPTVKYTEGRRDDISSQTIISDHMTYYGLGARDVFEVCDILSTSIAILPAGEVHIAYLLPLICGHIKGLPEGQVPAGAGRAPWVYEFHDNSGNIVSFGIDEIAAQYREKSLLSQKQAMDELNGGGATFITEAVFFETSRHRYRASDLQRIRNYPKLVTALARLSAPQAD